MLGNGIIDDAGKAAIQAMQGFASLSSILTMQHQLSRDLANLRAEIAQGRGVSEPVPDCWMDTKAAIKYMGVCRSTFDKYRYETTPRLKGCNLDGKTLYKRADIDRFVRLYELKSIGQA